MDKSFLTTIVLARHTEDTSWVLPFTNHIIIQKGEHLPNIGREPTSYLWFIIENYDKLNGVYFFLQANPLDHYPNIVKEIKNVEPSFKWLPTNGRTGLTCDSMGRPHDNVDVAAFAKQADIPSVSFPLKFHGCCLFRITAEEIREYPKDFYQKMYDIIMDNPKYAYAFERLVGKIFGGDL